MGSQRNSCYGIGRKKNRKVDKWGMKRRKKRRKKVRFLGYNKSIE
jgi:hypothetical protein